MSKSVYIKIRDKTRIIYRGLGALFRPALGELVYFDSAGLNHMIYKGKDRRPIPDQIRRFKLFVHVAHVIQKAGTVEKSSSLSNIQFWSVTHVVEDKEITVVIRQINQGRKHFYSVM